VTKLRSFRLSALTNSQLEELAEHWGTSLTATHAIIIDRVYRAQFSGDGPLPSLAEFATGIKEEILAELRGERHATQKTKEL